MVGHKIHSPRLISAVIVVLFLIPIIFSGCSRDSLKSLVPGKAPLPTLTVTKITYNWVRRAAYLEGDFSGKGYVNGVTVYVGEKVGDETRMWFTDTFYIKKDVNSDHWLAESYNVPNPINEEFQFKAVSEVF